jgi:hypothetical protein
MYSFPTFSESHWLPSAFEYGDLCSHNPLCEGIEVNPAENPEQLIEIDRAKKPKKVAVGAGADGAE